MLNYKEISLILSEIPFLDSYIQDVREKDFHSFTLSLFHKEEKAYSVYFEIANENAHFCITKRGVKKSRKAQRFTQFLRSRLIGAKIISVHQLSFDRAFYLKLLKNDRTFFLLFRFYSGPGANVILYDSDGKIEDLLFRRPKRNEISGEKIEIEERTEPPSSYFEVREYPKEGSFNEFIDNYYAEKERSESIESLKEDIERAKEKELGDIRRSIKRCEEKIKGSENYDVNKTLADLLSSSLHLVKKGMDEIIVDDYISTGKIRIALRKDLSPRENLEHYYKAYQKDKTSYEIAIKELEDEKRRLTERIEYYKRLEEEGDLKELKSFSELDKKKENIKRRYHGPSFLSYGFIIILGRNSRENDEILRFDARGNDLWLHTRDYAGGYAIIKCQKGKEVPFNVILDAAHLAVHFSKAKGANLVDLYYTYVKYLRRAKDSKEGLVLPTQEKNLSLRVDEKIEKEALLKRID